MAKYIFFFILTYFGVAYSQCNFKTGDYIEELSNPSNLKLIKINIPKSAKYSKNAFEIITSKTTNIPPDLRKEFVASITVFYKFGNCNYIGRVRQSGDWKDHISFINGQIIRSLDVKLNEGNIINAVGFKLLIPETRNGLNEILASLILKKLGFISPETFEVQTYVNGVNANMLFQEKARKELIERNKRREGPIFEGDESLLWTFMDKREKLKTLSLSRLLNENWFKKNKVAQNITIDSFKTLQESFVRSRQLYQIEGNQFNIFPNLLKTNKFVDFHAVLIAMNAEHAFYVHNRKFFFNTLETDFEPIYYDGDPNFLKKGYSQKYFDLIPKLPSYKLFDEISTINENDMLFQSFIDRTLNRKNREDFFTSSLENFKKNIFDLKKTISTNEKSGQIEKKLFELPDNWYQITQETLEVKQRILNKFEFNNGYYKGFFINGDIRILTVDDLAEIFSENKLDKKRMVYIPPKNNNKINSDVFQFKSLGIEFTMSNEMQFEIDKEKKILKFIQVNSNDWVLLSGGNFYEWEIIFEGLPNIRNENTSTYQRFNRYGLTGCLSFYKSYLINSSISINGGSCEDSINFINSYGENVKLVINNSFSDGLDADFSNLSISSITVDNAGNDCFDVSGGIYNVEYALLDGCKDKALSIGEKSVFVSNKISASNSNVAIAAKDFSKVEISMLKTKNVNLCAEVKQKKQEFGGALLSIKELMCSANIEIDPVSRFYRNTE